MVNIDTYNPHKLKISRILNNLHGIERGPENKV